MTTFFITGKLGSGKTLIAVARLVERYRAGARIATNIDIFWDRWPRPMHRHSHIYRLPDHPTRVDLDLLPCGNPTMTDGSQLYDEGRNGVLLLDEAGVFLNARGWQASGRSDLLAWSLHARKKGWDVYMIVQDVSLLDKQFRSTMGELVVSCRRFDRFPLPFVGWIPRLWGGKPWRFPRMHLGIVRMGLDRHGMITDRWWYRGTDLFGLYDTRQVLSGLEHQGTASMLSPWHLRGRYLPRRRGVLEIIGLGLMLVVTLGYWAVGSLLGTDWRRDAVRAGLLRRRSAGGYSRTKGLSG